MAYYLINLMSKFDFMEKVPLILNDLSLKHVFENSTLNCNSPHHSAVNSVCASARDKPEISLYHLSFGGINNACSSSPTMYEWFTAVHL